MEDKDNSPKPGCLSILQMRHFRWQLLIVLITGLVVGLILVFQRSATPLALESTPNPVTGGSFTEALAGEIIRLNPPDHFNQPDRDVDRLIFTALSSLIHADCPLAILPRIGRSLPRYPIRNQPARKRGLARRHPSHQPGCAPRSRCSKAAAASCRRPAEFLAADSGSGFRTEP